MCIWKSASRRDAIYDQGVRKLEAEVRNFRFAYLNHVGTKDEEYFRALYIKAMNEMKPNLARPRTGSTIPMADDKQISPLDEYGASQQLGPDRSEHDVEYNPEANPPQDAKAWLNLLHEAEDVFDNWHTRCDNIDKKYANIDRLVDLARAKEFQMFWANLEVIKPAIYAKAPVPVVVPKFNDRRPVYQAASDVMDPCCTVAFDLAEID